MTYNFEEGHMKIEKIRGIFGEEYCSVLAGKEKSEWIRILQKQPNGQEVLLQFFNKITSQEELMQKPSWVNLAQRMSVILSGYETQEKGSCILLNESFAKISLLYQEKMDHPHKRSSAIGFVQPPMNVLKITREIESTKPKIKKQKRKCVNDIVIADESMMSLYKRSLYLKDLEIISKDDVFLKFFIKSVKKESGLFEDELPATDSFIYENLAKRRNTYPYDKNRTGNEVKGFYLDASDIQTPLQNYIFAAAPSKEAFLDFWYAMACLRRSPTIVSLAMANENGKSKWEPYWEKSRFPLALQDGTTVDFENEEVVATSNILSQCRIVRRTYSVTSPSNSHPFAICQLHFENWPDNKGAPDLDLLEKCHGLVDMHHPSKDLPITVCCSAGKGRTGTFAAVDKIRKHILMERKSGKRWDEIEIDIRGDIIDFRKQRRLMVSTKEQVKTIVDMTIRALYAIKE
jgi:protein tyrosine phosphatase